MRGPAVELGRARDAVAEGRWTDAYEAFGGLDASSLTARDVERHADAAWWESREAESLELRQRAYSAYSEEGDRPRAAWCAARLSIEHFLHDEPAVAAGWLMRARRLVADIPECVEQGYLAVVEGSVSLFGGEVDRAMELEARAIEIGQRFRDRDLIAMGIHLRGLAMLASGRIADGVSLLDEAMTSVVARELSDYFTGVIYCNVLDACLEIGDLRRATEWSEAARAWCESISPRSPYPGRCRLNQAEVSMLRGDWAAAHADAVRASRELSWSAAATAKAFYETGEICRRRGDLRGAQEAFARSQELGADPQPGLALLRFDQGEIGSALTTLRLAISHDGGGPFVRARLLAAFVDVALAAGEREDADEAERSLASMATGIEAPIMPALSATATAAVALADDDPSTAVEATRLAYTRWQAMHMPYESGLARIRYGMALLRADAEEDGRAQISAAMGPLERLGAHPDVARAADLLGGRDDADRPGGLTAREVQVLRLLSTGKTNREIASELSISEHTVSRHLQNMFTKIEVSSRSGATAYAFEHGLA